MSPDALEPGVRLFGHEILRRLGRGGMGTVYLARQISLDRQVALKVLHPARVRNRQGAEDFFREARAAAALRHPHLVAIHDLHADPEAGIYAYAMDYVEGQTLARLVTDLGPLPATRALTLAGQVASALAAAHRAGFVHRDVKPENILVESGERARLLDLGLAYNRLGAVGAQVPSSGSSNQRQLLIVGTPEWSAPEQHRTPHQAGPASDVWSLGATLHFALLGRPPFGGDTVIDLIVRTATLPLDLPSTLPGHLRRLLETLMAKDPEDRPQDGDAMTEVISAACQGRAPGSSLVRRPMRRRLR